MPRNRDRSERPAGRLALDSAAGHSEGTTRELDRTRNRVLWQNLGLGALLVAAVLAVFGQAAWFGYVNFDDPEYIRNSKHVEGGPTPENLKWGLTTLYFANWHPLTWWSWQADVGLWGDNPEGHHVTNLLIHAVNALLVWRVMWTLSGLRFASFLLALVFAIHPLRWESVAWISERKGLLSALFALLAVDRYAAYARSPSLARMGIVAVCLALSLMSKAMAVTLPAVLLVLDWRPFGRWKSWRDGVWLALEKWPLWLLVAGSVFVTFIAQQRGGAVRTLHEVSGVQRVLGAAWAYTVYVGQTLWPANLCVFYPLPDHRPWWQAVVAIVVLLGGTIGAILAARRWPAVTVGWLCYLGMLVPVIGLVQLGGQAHADRYVYLPSIPLLAALGTVAVGLLGPRARSFGVGVAFAVLLISLALQSVAQGRVWRNGRTLWLHAARVAPCAESWWNVGILNLDARRYDDAARAFQEAVQLVPEMPEYQAGLAAALDGLERWDEAEAAANSALKLAGADLQETRARCHLILGKGAVRRGDLPEARRLLEEGLGTARNVELRSEIAVRLMRAGAPREALPHLTRIRDDDPDSSAAQGNVGNAYLELGDWQAAADSFGKAVELLPREPRLRSRWVTMLLASGQDDAARREVQILVKMDSNWPVASLRAAARMTSSADSTPSQIAEGYWLAAAVRLLFDPPPPEALDIMGMGAAGQGRFDEAARLGEEGAKLARAAGREDLAKAIDTRVEHYRAGRRPPTP